MEVLITFSVENLRRSVGRVLSMNVFIGLPGDYIVSEERPDVYGTKVGGCPILPTFCRREVFESAFCTVCGDPLALALQVRGVFQWKECISDLR